MVRIADEGLEVSEVHPPRIEKDFQSLASALKQFDLPTGAETVLAIAIARARIPSIAELHVLLPDDAAYGKLDMKDYFYALASSLRRSFLSRGAPALLMDAIPIRIPPPQATAIGLVTVELVTNAFKHAFAGRTPGTVSAALRAECADTLVLTIADSGIGIPDEILYHGGKRGLRIVEALVRQLQGEMRVRNDDNGTLFFLEFPRAIDATTHSSVA
jgi:two-component sensor histidine kinase